MGVVDLIMDLIFRPGSSLRLIPVINAAIIGLFGLLIALSYTHLVVMSFLGLGLMASVNW